MDCISETSEKFEKPPHPSTLEDHPNILEKLTEQYTFLTKSHQRVADCILSDPMQSIGEHISELALRACVSDATVTRFCAVIGVPGYPALRKFLIYAIEKSRQPTSIEAHLADRVATRKDLALWVKHLCERFPQNFEDIVPLIANSKNLILLGLGQAAFLCEFLYGHFAGQFEGLLSVGMSGVSVAEKQLGACDQKDALILLSNRDTLPEEKWIIQIAEQKRISVISAQGIQKRQGKAQGSGAHTLRDSRRDDIHASFAAIEAMRCVLAAALVKRNAAVYCGLPLREAS